MDAETKFLCSSMMNAEKNAAVLKISGSPARKIPRVRNTMTGLVLFIHEETIAKLSVWKTAFDRWTNQDDPVIEYNGTNDMLNCVIGVVMHGGCSSILHPRIIARELYYLGYYKIYSRFRFTHCKGGSYGEDYHGLGHIRNPPSIRACKENKLKMQFENVRTLDWSKNTIEINCIITDNKCMSFYVGKFLENIKCESKKYSFSVKIVGDCDRHKKPIVQCDCMSSFNLYIDTITGTITRKEKKIVIKCKSPKHSVDIDEDIEDDDEANDDNEKCNENDNDSSDDSDDSSDDNDSNDDSSSSYDSDDTSGSDDSDDSN